MIFVTVELLKCAKRTDVLISVCLLWTFFVKTQVHEFVVDSVIKKSREVFEEMGVSETVLGALQKVCEK